MSDLLIAIALLCQTSTEPQLLGKMTKTYQFQCQKSLTSCVIHTYVGTQAQWNHPVHGPPVHGPVFRLNAGLVCLERWLRGPK